MSRPKKYKPNTQMTITHRDLKRIKDEISHRTLILITAYLMDELDYDEDRIIEMWDGIANWAHAIDHDKLIKLQDVCDIINQHTGLKIQW